MKGSYAMLPALFFGLCASPAAAQEDCGVSATIELTLPTCGEYANGAVTVNVTGGTGTYTYYLNGFEFAGPTANNLVSGSYSYWVVDEKNCWYKADFYLDCVPEDDNCEFRTQTQGGWGANPNGNNPATYLQANFASCFPNGVTIGCATGNTLTLTSSNAVRIFLPSGSTPSQLPNDLVNPGGSYSNVLAGQLVAATISVTFDSCDPDFGGASSWLGDATYVGGTFAGWTVAEVIDAANQFIGGCGGSYSASDFNEALSDLNENYVGGNTDNGNISCGGKKSLTVAGTTVGVFPNPASSTATVQVAFAAAGTGTLLVNDMTGRTVAQYRVSAVGQGVQMVDIDVDALNAGSYVIGLQMNGAYSSTRLVVSK